MSDLEEESEEALKEYREREFERYRTRFYKSGYREALENDEVNEEILQGSFDEGYTIGLRLGRKFSVIRFSTKLAEGMYEEQRLLANSQEALQKLKDFNLKLDGLWAQLDTLIRKGCETKEDLTKVIMTFYFCSALPRGFCFISLCCTKSLKNADSTKTLVLKPDLYQI